MKFTKSPVIWAFKSPLKNISTAKNPVYFFLQQIPPLSSKASGLLLSKYLSKSYYMLQTGGL